MNSSAIQKIKDFKTLAHFLAEELNWPIDPDNVDVEDLVFDYSAEDIGLSEEFATKVKFIKQIRPLDSNQPWSIFWIDFENKKLPLTVLRRILNVFVIKKRGNSRNLATKELEDIMFVSGHGEDANRAITFAHFKRLDDVETIREFYWDGHETKFDHISNYLEKLEWPANTTDVSAWREKWKSAFTGSTREAISNSDQLAKAMANIAKNIRDRVLEVLSVEHKDGPVHNLFDTFKSGLVHDMTEKGFADMYAQTITYGLFSARSMDTDGHFELHEVIDLIPSTNPFLKSLFKECLKTGNNKHKIDLDELGVGSLVDLFDNLNRSDGTDAMQRILAEFGRQTLSGQEDPVIHFYEGFLCEYDNLQRVKQGVYYTPDPVVGFIVRSVNEQLKSEFGLEMGLADTTTWAEMVTSGRAEYPVDPKTGKSNKEWIEKIKMRAFVQILDPATGTGTFLKHTIELIHLEVKAKHKRDKTQIPWLEYWNDYVYKNLLPRIYGFEIMMASYSVAHMKIGMYLKSLGYSFEKEQRLNIYLTNTLEPHTAINNANLFFTSIGAEAAGANNVKKNRLFTVIIGNPPYSKLSGNLSEEVRKTIEIYKFSEGKKIVEKSALQLEMNLQDDYVKFIRFGQTQIDKNGIGILSFISNNGYLRNPTLRGMRFSLTNSFNNMKLFNLHNDGRENQLSKDENVFDIVQEVAVCFMIKSKLKKQIEYQNISGSRIDKYNFLNNNNCNDVNFLNIKLSSPHFNFIEENTNDRIKFNSWYSLDKIFKQNGAGILTARDGLAIDFQKLELAEKIKAFRLGEGNDDDIYQKFNFDEGTRFKLRAVIHQLQTNKNDIENQIHPLSYRPFDDRYVFYNSLIVWSMSNPTTKHIVNKNNLCLVSTRQVTKGKFEHVFVTKKISELKYCSHNRSTQTFPLFTYSDNEKFSNLDLNFLNEFNRFYTKTVSDKFNISHDVFNYIYAILHSVNYRNEYSPFLKSEFARIPITSDENIFFRLVDLGKKLIEIHLLEFEFSNSSNELLTNRFVEVIKWKDQKVFINKSTYIAIVCEDIWNFGIGGYKPAQKWLKSRKNRELSVDDINHYQKIIVALTETDRLMKEIDKIEIE
jgi:predicted helicase